jgi:hypothetical protein
VPIFKIDDMDLIRSCGDKIIHCFYTLAAALIVGAHFYGHAVYCFLNFFFCVSFWQKFITGADAEVYSKPA